LEHKKERLSKSPSPPGPQSPRRAKGASTRKEGRLLLPKSSLNQFTLFLFPLNLLREESKGGSRRLQRKKAEFAIGRRDEAIGKKEGREGHREKEKYPISRMKNGMLVAKITNTAAKKEEKPPRFLIERRSSTQKDRKKPSVGGGTMLIARGRGGGGWGLKKAELFDYCSRLG